MTAPIPVSDKRSRLAWRLYFLRAEAALASAPAATRRELLADLRAHVSALLVNGGDAGAERDRLKAALHRVGDPKEFLSPLLATTTDAPSRGAFIGRKALYYGVRIAAFCGVALIVGAVFAFSVVLALSASGSLIEPERFGVFQVGEGQLRIGTTSDLARGTYHQLLSPATAIPLVALTLAAAFWSALVGRAMLLRLVALTLSTRVLALL
jgi:hypothetical protein